MSTGRYARLVQMMNLSSLDKDEPPTPQILKPAEDVIELEIRRRTFWMAFCNDRWASAGTGWPMAIAESDVRVELTVHNFIANDERYTPIYHAPNTLSNVAK